MECSRDLSTEVSLVVLSGLVALLVDERAGGTSDVSDSVGGCAATGELCREGY
jgi:hypothetical protein